MKKTIGSEGMAFLLHGLKALERLLPHTEIDLWKVGASSAGKTGARYDNPDRKHQNRQLKLCLVINTGDQAPDSTFELRSRLRRKTSGTGGVGDIARVVDLTEKNLCEKTLQRLASVLVKEKSDVETQSLHAISKMFDELVIASHLKEKLQIEMNVAQLFASLRELAEQSYENKSLSFGLLITSKKETPSQAAIFPRDFFEFKRYRALSDGFKTAYKVSSAGKVFGLIDLRHKNPTVRADHFYPEWCQYIAEASHEGFCGICLTRQGDILIFEAGNLRFTYRCGKWQYWNHRHIIDILRNKARVQHVRENVLPKVVRSLYRVVLDVSFRRSGGLFVLLRNQKKIKKIVPKGEAIGDTKREEVHKAFDESLSGLSIQNTTELPRTVLAEIAALDGGVILNNHGQVLAYASVLITRLSKKLSPAEGSRTKAAISASHHGLAVKISSDGDITCYEDGNSFLKI